MYQFKWLRQFENKENNLAVQFCTTNNKVKIHMDGMYRVYRLLSQSYSFLYSSFRLLTNLIISKIRSYVRFQTKSKTNKNQTKTDLANMST